MTGSRRLPDLILVIPLGVLLILPFLAVMLAHMALMGRPFLFASERMHSPTRSFTLWKLRSMHPTAKDGGVSGGDKAGRIPPWGRFLRASRLDELPQFWNILRGDMRLIGPRPPLRQYLERFPEIYSGVLCLTPGLTGFATVVFQHHEKRILATCRTAEETDAVYARRCVARKARLDRIYADRQSLALDGLILFWTGLSIVCGPQRRHWRPRQPGRMAAARPAVGLWQTCSHRLAGLR